MNGNRYSHDPFNGSYTVNDRIYRNNYPSNILPDTSNTYYRHSYSQPVRENNQSSYHHSQQTNTINRRRVIPNNLPLPQKQQQQQQQQRSHHDLYKPEYTGTSPSTSYYDHIHARYRSNTSLNRIENSTQPSTNFQYSRDPSPIIRTSRKQQNVIDVSTDKSIRVSPRPQSSVSRSTTIADQSLLLPPQNDHDDLPLDYPHYTMDLLIQQLVPTETYIPKSSFFYPMFLCSRIHIRPNLLLNKLARLTINSITSLTRDRSVRTMKNFLYILSQWTRTFPYDFRNTEMIRQLEDILKKIDIYEPSLKSDTHHINKKLHSKLQALAEYEEYIRQLNKKALNSLTQMALFTDIINECPTPLLFAQQLTHIELDRLKPIGAEELIQYFIMKLAFEEERAHPNHVITTSNCVHDTKLTFCLETYIQWFNRLTFFVTTEIIKHTQRRVRMRMINYFIDTAYECFRMRNFNSMIGILGGLNMQPVKRLKRTWEKLSSEKFDQLEQYTNVSRNFSNYRMKLKEIMEDARKSHWTNDKIVIPFMSIVLQDVYYIKTHSKDHTEENGINLKKYYSLAKVISEQFVECKQSRCSFERNDVIINYVTTSPIFSEDALMLASFECEPPVTPNEKEKLSLLQTSVNNLS